MKTYRERFINNHRKEMQIAPNKKGYRTVLVYTGNYYTWEPEKGSLSSYRRLFLILEICTILLFGLSSIPGTAVSYSPPAMSGALISLVAWAFEAFALVSLCFRRLPLQEDDFSYVHRFFRITTSVRCVCLLFTVITGTIYINDKGSVFTDILSLVGYFLAAVLAAILFFLYHRLARYKKVLPGESGNTQL